MSSIQLAKRPRALGAGARVALVAPAGPVTVERVEVSKRRCEALGLEPVVFPAATARHRFLAGTDEQRLADLQAAFDDPAVDAIWPVRGGYGTGRILERLDLSRQQRAPIPFIGFSDNTTIHARHRALGVISFHGPHSGGDFPPESEEAFRRVLFDARPPGMLPLRAADPAPRTLVPGTAEGPLLGGNLSLMASLCGTPYAVPASGCILFLEDVGEPAYRIDRMLLQLYHSGVLEGVAGLAFGRFTEAPDADLHPVEDALLEMAERIGVPAAADFPIGHIEHNWTMPIGARATLDANAATLVLTEAAVTGGP